MDESTSALDTRNERLLYEALRAAGVTYVSVGHRRARQGPMLPLPPVAVRVYEALRAHEQGARLPAALLPAPPPLPHAGLRAAAAAAAVQA